MQRIFNISKWTRIPSGSVLRFTGDRPRKVLVDVNSPGEVVMSLLQGERVDFLATFKGRDTLEFYVSGPFGLTASGADCYVYTADGDGWSVQPLDCESFTVIRDRRPRNPELDYIVAAMERNMAKRLAQQAEELTRAVRRGMGARAVQPPAAVAARRDDEADATDDGEAAGSAEPPVPSGERPPRGRPRSR